MLFLTNQLTVQVHLPQSRAVPSRRTDISKLTSGPTQPAIPRGRLTKNSLGRRSVIQ